MTETLLPELEDAESRKAVIEVILALLNRWNLDEVDQCKLLGVTKLPDLQASELLLDETSVFKRIGHMLAIERELSRLYPYQSKKHDRWMMEPQEKLDGQIPLAIMLNLDIEGMKHIRHILESQYMMF